MLYFLIGIITGLLIATILVVTMVYFRRAIEHKTTVVENRIESAGPRPRGSVFVPPDDAEEVRESIIEKNRRQGRDTPLSDLI